MVTTGGRLVLNIGEHAVTYEKCFFYLLRLDLKLAKLNWSTLNHLLQKTIFDR